MGAIAQDRYGSPDGLPVREIDEPIVGDDRLLARALAVSIDAAEQHRMAQLPDLIGMLIFGRRPSRFSA